MKYRHEIKHVIDFGEALSVEKRLEKIAERDPHSKNGKYFIRSLYFDTPTDKALRERENGVPRRHKFRLRYYNGDVSFVKLEKKSKINGLCLKQSTVVSREEATAIIKGDIGWMLYDDRELLRELYVKCRTEGLKAKTVVDYERIPFVFGAGNVRVTLDGNIRTGFAPLSFFDTESVTVPTATGVTVLEVKWDEYLPEIIRAAVQIPTARSGAFSKYAVCRKFG